MKEDKLDIIGEEKDLKILEKEKDFGPKIDIKPPTKIYYDIETSQGRFKKFFSSGKTIKGHDMPPAFMNVVTGDFVTSWVFMHVLSILIVESFSKLENSIALKCAFVYFVLLGIATIIGWICHKYELVKVSGYNR